MQLGFKNALSFFLVPLDYTSFFLQRRSEVRRRRVKKTFHVQGRRKVWKNQGGGEGSSNVVGIIAPPLIQIGLTALSKSEGAITPLPPVSDGPDVKTRFMTGIRSLWFMKKQVKVQQLKEFYLWQILSICFFPLQLYFFFIKRRKKKLNCTW